MSTRVPLLLLCGVFSFQFREFWCDDNEDYVENKTEQIKVHEFGDAFINDLEKEFPNAFKEKISVNLTEETEKVLEQEKFEKKYYDVDSYEIEKSDNFTYSEEYYDENIVENIKKFVTKRGKRALKSLGYKIKNHLSPTLYINKIIHHANMEYVAKLDKYYTTIREKEIQTHINRELVALDLLESANNILSKEAKQLYAAIVIKSEVSLLMVDVEIISETIQNNMLGEKTMGLEYACEKKYFCKKFPAYSDYVSELMKEILALSDKNLMTFVKIVKYIVIDNAPFFESLMDDDIAQNISSEMESIIEIVSDISEFIFMIKGMLKYRFKIFYNRNAELNNSTKANRILLDLIDKTFEILGNNRVKVDFIKITKHIDNWANGKEKNIHQVLSNFFEEYINFLKHYWNKEIKYEIKVLIRIIVTGTSNNDHIRDILLTEGSVLVRDNATIYSDYDTAEEMVEIENNTSLLDFSMIQRWVPTNLTLL